jgi:hypothetical protein
LIGIAWPNRPSVRRSATRAAVTIALVATTMTGPATTEPRFEDPFAYCAAVGTIDAPDARYAGPTMPDAVARGLKAAFDMPESAPLEPFRDRSTWRCMAGKVYACTAGANLPCGEKADTSRSPTSAMTAFCRDNPGSDAIPMVVTGRATVYAGVARAAPRRSSARLPHPMRAAFSPMSGTRSARPRSKAPQSDLSEGVRRVLELLTIARREL